MRRAWQVVLTSGQGKSQAELAESLSGLLLVGESQKRKAATAMNERSSRAHSLLILRLKQTRGSSGGDGPGATVESQLCLADLGGSEQVKKSKVSGERLSEAININQGLLSLKNCIVSLTIVRLSGSSVALRHTNRSWMHAPHPPPLC